MKEYENALKEVCLEITDACPLNCLHCSGICGLGSLNMLSLLQIKTITAEFSSMGGKILEISGGEPLMHPRLLKIVECAAKQNLETILYTSGSMLNSSGRITSIDAKVAEELQESGLKKVIFNLQGATSSIHEAVTQVEGSFRNVIQMIKTMKSLGFWVGAHFVPMKLNYKGLGDVLLLCHDLEVDEVGVLRFVPQGRGEIHEASLKLSAEEFRDFIRDLKELTYKHTNPNIRVGRPIDFRQLLDASFAKPKCDAGISRCLITPEGKVVPCPAFKQTKQYEAGNVKNSSLGHIWNRSPIWSMFRYFDYKQINDPCRSCRHLHECRGGCQAQRIIKYNDIYAAPDPNCFKCAMPMAAIGSSDTRIPEL